MAKRASLAASIQAKKHKTCGRGEKLLEDRISGLPDEILVCILSLLMIKEAGRTSVLSKRWRYIWTSTPSLKFDASPILDELQLETKLLEVGRPVYISWVNQVLNLHKGPTIDEFRVRFDLDESCSHDINNWVKFAMEKRVQRLKLDLSDYYNTAQYELYTFPDLWGSMNHLHRQPIGFSSCNSLTTLQLTQVNVTGEVLQYFLSNCPFLECLSVEGSKSLVNLKVAGPLLNLKFLDICYCFAMNCIQISAPNLLSFNYIGPKISVPFNKFPKLVELSIGHECGEYLTNNFLKFSSYLSQLETLTLGINRIERSMKSVEFPVFIKLKQLKLILSPYEDVSLLGFSSLIKASPFLHKFTLELNGRKPAVARKQQKAAACPHHCLKVVEFVGFFGHAMDIEFAMYLVENAVMLEKIIFDPREPMLMGSPWEFEDTKDKREARKRANQLRTKLPPGVDLIIL